MKVIYFIHESWEEAYVGERLLNIDTGFFAGPIHEHEDVSDSEAEVLCIFVDSTVGAKEMDRFPALKLIATRSTGFDHIDIVEAKKRNITVASVPSYGVNTVAEFTFALLLALSRKVCEARARVSGGKFSQEGLMGFDLAGKTIGVIGCGRIGVHTVAIARGFGMRVLVYEPHRDEALAQKMGFTYKEIQELLAESDIITLHVPYNEHTHHLINHENIRLIKRGAYLINTARGAVVETAALVEALKDGVLAGAGLDVLEEEGDMQDEMRLLASAHPQEEKLRIMLENHYLMEHPHVIVTPHIAFDTVEAVRRILDTTIENISSFFATTA